MRIGELAKKAGCPVQTIRFYEKAGLMRAPRRTSANYREYGPEHAERLAFITRCRSLDMSLPEIRRCCARLKDRTMIAHRSMPYSISISTTSRQESPSSRS